MNKLSKEDEGRKEDIERKRDIHILMEGEDHP
jgi:hypothetical protein